MNEKKESQEFIKAALAKHWLRHRVKIGGILNEVETEMHNMTTEELSKSNKEEHIEVIKLVGSLYVAAWHED